MDDSKFDKLIKQLKNIETKLDLLVKFTRITTPKIEVSGEEKKILKLCNLKNTISDIMKKTGKTRNNVQVTLSHLNTKGLIKAERLKGKCVYGRIR